MEIWYSAGQSPIPAAKDIEADRAPAQRERESTMNGIRIAVLIGALLLLAVGLATGALGIVVSLFAPGTERVMGIAFSASILVLSGGFGLPLAWHAWQAAQGQGSAPFRPARTWALVVMFGLVLAAGGALLALDAPTLTFTPFYIIGVVLPPLIVVALVGQSLTGLTRWRDMILQLSSGALIATSLAFMAEIVAILGLASTSLLALALRPGGPALIEALTERLQAAGPVATMDESVLLAAAASPVVIAAVIVVMAGLVPLIEEAVKTIGVGLLAYRRPRLAETTLWGLAGGAGFALAEGLLNSAAGVDAWLVAAVSRAGTALLHCFTGVVIGIAWYHLLSGRQWGRFLGLYAGAVAAHGMWNAAAVGLAFLSLQSPDGAEVVGVGGAMVILAAAMAIGLVALTRWVQRQTTAGH